jgi:predicted  nucleic acid-binding Zn-ribbon protein
MQLLQMQAQMSNNVVTWEQEKRTYEDMVYDLQKRVAALEKAPEKRNEEFNKLWNWVKAIEQRLIRTERGEPAKPGSTT